MELKLPKNHDGFEDKQYDQALADLISSLHRCGLEGPARQLEASISVMLETRPEYRDDTHPDPKAHVMNRLEAFTLKELQRMSEIDVSTVEGRQEAITIQGDNGTFIRMVREAARAQLEPTQFLRKLAELLATHFTALAALVQQKNGKEKTILCIHTCDIREVEARVRAIIADNEEHVRALLKNGSYAREYEKIQR